MEQKNIWALVSITSFIDSFQFLSSSLDSSIKNLDKDNLKYLGHELRIITY